MPCESGTPTGKEPAVDVRRSTAAVIASLGLATLAACSGDQRRDAGHA